MTEMAFTNELQNVLQPNKMGMTDLDLLQFLTMRNLEREDNKLFSTCLFALRSAEANAGGDREALSEEFFEALRGVVARGLDKDEEAEKLAENAGAD